MMGKAVESRVGRTEDLDNTPYRPENSRCDFCSRFGQFLPPWPSY